MAKSGLLGPYKLNFDTIDAASRAVPRASTRWDIRVAEGRFCINHIGRADSDVKSKLRNCIGSATLFKFGYLPNSKAAFERECELFHELSPPGNRVHPGRAQGTSWDCPRCRIFARRCHGHDIRPLLTGSYCKGICYHSAIHTACRDSFDQNWFFSKHIWMNSISFRRFF